MVRILEATLGQTANQRNLTTLEVRTVRVAGTGTRTLLTTTRSPARAGTVTTANALARLPRNRVLQFMKFHLSLPYLA